MKTFFHDLYDDAKNILKKDPAARNILTVILLYPGFHVLVWHKINHFLYKKHLYFISRLLSQLARFLTGIERCSNWKKVIYRSWYGYSNW